jgi:hypothetical protein
VSRRLDTKLTIVRLVFQKEKIMNAYAGSYGNERTYRIARLERDGFQQLAANVRHGLLSARFATELAKTVPPEHLDELTEWALRFGPRKPEGWQGWEQELKLARFTYAKNKEVKS